MAPDVLQALSAVVRSVPDGFMIHPKLERQFVQRDELVAERAGRLGPGRGAGHRLAHVRGRQRPPDRPGHPPRHLQPPPRRPGRLRQRRGVRPAGPHPRRPAPHRRGHAGAGGGDGQLHRPRLPALRVRRRRLRVRLLGRGARGAGGLGGAVRRLRQRRPDHHRQLPGGGREQVGPVRRASSCCCRTATRARGPSTRRRASSASCRCRARGNLRVTVPSTAAQYFHLLRSQARRARSGRSSWSPPSRCCGPTRRARPSPSSRRARSST